MPGFEKMRPKREFGDGKRAVWQSRKFAESSRQLAFGPSGFPRLAVMPTVGFSNEKDRRAARHAGPIE